MGRWEIFKAKVLFELFKYARVIPFGELLSGVILPIGGIIPFLRIKLRLYESQDLKLFGPWLVLKLPVRGVVFWAEPND